MTPPNTVTTLDFADPAFTITYFEGDENDGGVENTGGDGPVESPELDPYNRHGRGSNYLFADGHADYATRAPYASPSSPSISIEHSVRRLRT